MDHVFRIDGTSQKAQALLEFLRTLEFVQEETSNEFGLTERHLAILEERRNNRTSGKSKTYSWEEVKESLGKKKAG